MQGAALNSGVACSICDSPDEDILKCCRCLVKVHERCYGVPIIQQPKQQCGGWMCERCYFDAVREDPLDEISEPSRVKCQYCPRQDGAMKMFRYEYIEENTYWAHVNCVQLHQAFRYDTAVDPQLKIPLKQKVIFKEMERDFEKTFARQCELCHSERGMAVRCTGRDKLRDCKYAFHIGCAFANDILKYPRAISYLLFNSINLLDMKMLCMKHLTNALNDLRYDSDKFVAKKKEAGYTLKQEIQALYNHIDSLARKEQKKDRDAVPNKDDGEVRSLDASVITLSSREGSVDPTRFKKLKKRGSATKNMNNSQRKKILKENNKPTYAKKGRPPKVNMPKIVKRIVPNVTQIVELTPSIRSAQVSKSNHRRQPPAAPRNLKQKIHCKKTITLEESVEGSFEQASEREFLNGLQLLSIQRQQDPREQEEVKSNESIELLTSSLKPNTLCVCSEQHCYTPFSCFRHFDKFKEVTKLSHQAPTATDLPLLSSYTPVKQQP